MGLIFAFWHICWHIISGVYFLPNFSSICVFWSLCNMIISIIRVKTHLPCFCPASSLVMNMMDASINIFLRGAKGVIDKTWRTRKMIRSTRKKSWIWNIACVWLARVAHIGGIQGFVTVLIEGCYIVGFRQFNLVCDLTDWLIDLLIDLVIDLWIYWLLAVAPRRDCGRKKADF